MYRMTCDGLPLLDLRDESYVVFNPRIRCEVNTVGDGSFRISKAHPNFTALSHLRSLFEVRDEYGVIFRGRMTEDTADFDNFKDVDLEGVMAYFNDSVVRPYTFPDDFKDRPEYIAASTSGNVIEFYLSFLINQHNEQVEPFQQFKLGTVTVSDPNNVLTRSETEYPSTWQELEDKLFNSTLGGFLCIRYEDDGNYIDYLKEFTEVNEQKIVFGENLLGLTRNTVSRDVYSAIIPRGAEIEREESDGNTYEGLYGTITGGKTIKERLTIAGNDYDVDSDIVKSGDMLYSKRAVAKYGLRIAPPSETVYEDITTTKALTDRGVEFLRGNAVKLPSEISCTACDLNCTDAQIRSFRIYKKVEVYSPIHDTTDTFDLTTLDLDLINPQATGLTVGKIVHGLTGNLEKKTKSIEQALSNYATNDDVKKAFDNTEIYIKATSSEDIKNALADYKTEVERLIAEALKGDTGGDDSGGDSGDDSGGGNTDLGDGYEIDPGGIASVSEELDGGGMKYSLNSPMSCGTVEARTMVEGAENYPYLPMRIATTEGRISSVEAIIFPSYDIKAIAAYRRDGSVIDGSWNHNAELNKWTFTPSHVAQEENPVQEIYIYASYDGEQYNAIPLDIDTDENGEADQHAITVTIAT